MATGEGEEYDHSDEDAISDAIVNAYRTPRPPAAGPPLEPGEEPEIEAGAGPEPGAEAEPEPSPGPAPGQEVTGKLHIRAQIEWAGEVARTNDGVRTVRFPNVRLNEIQAAAAQAQAARQAGPEGGFRSYRAKGWRAQLRQTLATKRGREAAAAAGLNPDTIRRWRKGEQAPTARSREKITNVWDQVRDPRRHAVREANHQVTEALTDALRGPHGVTIRFRNIQSLNIIED